MASVWCQVLNKVKASAMMNLSMCDYVCGFLAVLGQYLLVFISYVNFFKLQVIIFLVISNVQDVFIYCIWLSESKLWAKQRVTQRISRIFKNGES